MKLPEVNKTLRRMYSRQREQIAFKGLDLRESARAGALTDCTNLSTVRWPSLSPRHGRATLAKWENATAVFAWDGKLISVRDGILYCDEEPIVNVTPGEKQFAVVNTKLCVWPDKLAVDLTNQEYERLDADVLADPTAHSVSIAGNSISANMRPNPYTDLCGTRMVINAFQVSYPWKYSYFVYTYGDWSEAEDIEALEACYSEGTGWDQAALAALAENTALFRWESYHDSEPEGKLFIPSMTEQAFDLVSGLLHEGSPIEGQEPDVTKYNSEGYYGVLTEADPEHYELYGTSEVMWHFDVYKVGASNPALSGIFRAGDAVTVQGTLYGFGDIERRIVLDIDADTNTMYFTDGTFTAPAGVYEIETDLAAGDYVITLGEDSYTATTDQTAEAGKVLYLLNGDAPKLGLWDPVRKRTVAEWDAVAPDEESEEEQEETRSTEESRSEEETRGVEETRSAEPVTIAMTAYDPTGEDLHLLREVPDLDFICERDNRLWGVSNRQENVVYDPDTGESRRYTSRCIYASALGDPSAWWSFAGLSTDSWQLAVGSEGDFTALCAYDNGICAWKERSMYRVTGSYPAEYLGGELALNGVQAGSFKSLVNLNETLLYQGTDGVYAYRGGAPQLISEALGDRRYTDGRAGANSQRYYLSHKLGNNWELLTYDLRYGVWLREDDLQAVDFCTFGTRLLVLTTDGTLLELEAGDPGEDKADNVVTQVAWNAEFARLPEDDMPERKRNLRLIMRYALNPREGRAPMIQAERKKSGTWLVLWSAAGSGEDVKPIPMAPDRLDSLRLRVEGTGDAAVRTLFREYLVGSIYGGEAGK